MCSILYCVGLITPARCCARQLTPPVWRGILPTAGAASLAGVCRANCGAQHLKQASPTAPPPLQRQYCQDNQKQGESLAQPQPRLFEHFITCCPTKKFGDTGHGGTG